jgi:hypothetical protein
MEAPRTIIAVTGEDDRYTETRDRAVQRALDGHATLILYDLDAGRDPLESPLPTEWSAEGTDDEVADRLGPEELAAAGRGAIADQVRAAREAGVDAWGWLPERDDRATLLEYAEGQPEPLILVPDGETELAETAGIEAEVVETGEDR